VPGVRLRANGGYCRTDVLSVPSGAPSTEILRPRRRSVDLQDSAATVQQPRKRGFVPRLGRLIIDGDSLTENHGYPPEITTWPVKFAADFPSVSVINSAHAGDAFQPELIPGGATRVDANYDPTKAVNVLLAFCGTNDMGDHSRTAAATYALLQQWCADRRAAHPLAKIAVCNVIARADIEPARTTYNALLAADGLTSFDVLIDVATALQDWSSQPSWWYADNVHLTDAGQLVLASAIGAVLGPVFA
jgi:lysophospholipase L1-like esterase